MEDDSKVFPSRSNTRLRVTRAWGTVSTCKGSPDMASRIQILCPSGGSLRAPSMSPVPGSVAGFARVVRSLFVIARRVPSRLRAIAKARERGDHFPGRTRPGGPVIDFDDRLESPSPWMRREQAVFPSAIGTPAAIKRVGSVPQPQRIGEQPVSRQGEDVTPDCQTTRPGRDQILARTRAEGKAADLAFMALRNATREDRAAVDVELDGRDLAGGVGDRHMVRTERQGLDPILTDSEREIVSQVPYRRGGRLVLGRPAAVPGRRMEQRQPILSHIVRQPP